jgi:hypothetical protein
MCERGTARKTDITLHHDWEVVTKTARWNPDLCARAPEVSNPWPHVARGPRYLKKQQRLSPGTKTENDTCRTHAAPVCD